MRRAPRFVAVLTATTLALGSVALPAFAQGKPAAAEAPAATKIDEARARYKRGIELYEEQDYAAALIEFRRAHELAPNTNVLYNIGQAYYQLTDYAGALRAFDRYLAEGGTNVPEARRKEVEREVERLRSRVAKLEVTTNVPGAEITVDDVSAGHTPLTAPIVVSAGRRRIAATLPGKTPATRTLEVAGGDMVTVPLELTDPTPVFIPPQQQAVAEKPRSPIAPIAWGATGVLAAGTLVTGILALSAASDLRATRDRAGATRADLDSAQSKTKTLGLVTDIFGVATLVGIGVSTYLTIRASKRDELAVPTNERTPAARGMQNVRVGIAGAGLMLGGEF